MRDARHGLFGLAAAASADSADDVTPDPEVPLGCRRLRPSRLFFRVTFGPDSVGLDAAVSATLPRRLSMPCPVLVDSIDT